MIRSLLGFILVVLLVVAAAAFFLGYRWGDLHLRNGVATAPVAHSTSAVGTTGGDADTVRERARAAGADVADKVTAGVERAAETLDEAGLTAKVKSKIALDDTLDGSRIGVSTRGQQVTLTGTVVNEAQHQRALALARETDGVARVFDRLSLLQPASR